jgi:hypothetical protein
MDLIIRVKDRYGSSQFSRPKNHVGMASDGSYMYVFSKSSNIYINAMSDNVGDEVEYTEHRLTKIISGIMTGFRWQQDTMVQVMNGNHPNFEDIEYIRFHWQ